MPASYKLSHGHHGQCRPKWSHDKAGCRNTNNNGRPQRPFFSVHFSSLLHFFHDNSPPMINNGRTRPQLFFSSCSFTRFHSLFILLPLFFSFFDFPLFLLRSRQVSGHQTDQSRPLGARIWNFRFFFLPHCTQWEAERP